MKYKHDWRLGKITSGYQILDNTHQGNVVVAALGDTERGPHRTELCKERAKLLVAAPHLLGTCEELLKVKQWYDTLYEMWMKGETPATCPDVLSVRDLHYDADMIAKAAENVIAKAKGQPLPHQPSETEPDWSGW